MLSEDAKAVVASNFVVAKAVFTAAKNQKELVDAYITVWYEEFCDLLEPGKE